MSHNLPLFFLLVTLSFRNFSSAQHENLCSSGHAKSCSEIQSLDPNSTFGRTKNCVIFPFGPESLGVEVKCDFESAGGGWTIIQQRLQASVADDRNINDREEFYRDWVDYEQGFYGKGQSDLNANASASYWIGLKTIHALTLGQNQELRIELIDWDGNGVVAGYSSFFISDAADFYRLSVSGFSGDSGNPGDALTYHNGSKFSTRDQDNDNYFANCAAIFHGAWWYNACHDSNLNGYYRQKDEVVPYADGVIWDRWKGDYYSISQVQMKIRDKNMYNKKYE